MKDKLINEKEYRVIMAALTGNTEQVPIEDIIECVRTIPEKLEWQKELSEE